ncbi:MAG: hypothetical protein M0P57_13480 [Syntrophales bacterium]|jgi:hypothetical protein|nr:hypothetical protein [Syntrophales bacterium]MDY0044940.1 hypothetical protein [Syntrophales bacterium]
METNDFTSHMYRPPDQSLKTFEELVNYALSIDGYAYAEKMWKVEAPSEEISEKIDSFKKNGVWGGTFEDLRCCLFFYQRHIRQNESEGYDSKGREEFAGIYKALCKAWDKKTFRLDLPAG